MTGSDPEAEYCSEAEELLPHMAVAFTTSLFTKTIPRPCSKASTSPVTKCTRARALCLETTDFPMRL